MIWNLSSTKKTGGFVFMKKAALVVLSVMMAFLCPMTAFAAELEGSTIDDRISEYQTVLNKLNEELGSALMIPEEAKETIYNAYKDYTLEEFEEETRQKYLDAVSSLDSYSPGNNPRGNSVARYEIFDSTQLAYLGNESALGLASTIRVSGYPSVYTYEAINGVYMYYTPGYTGFVVNPGPFGVVLSRDYQSCTVSAAYTLVDANGMTDLVQRNLSVTFYASNG